MVDYLGLAAFEAVETVDRAKNVEWGASHGRLQEKKTRIKCGFMDYNTGTPELFFPHADTLAKFSDGVINSRAVGKINGGSRRGCCDKLSVE